MSAQRENIHEIQYAVSRFYFKREIKEVVDDKMNYLQAAWMISAAFSRNPVVPTVEPVAPAIKKEI